MNKGFVLCSFTIIAFSGFFLETTDPLSQYVIPVEDGWGAEQDMAHPYCDTQILVRLINGTTQEVISSNIIHFYCNV